MAKKPRDRTKYAQQQTFTTEKYVIPFCNFEHSLSPQTKVLEIGCGEGGNLKPFVKAGSYVVGVDIKDAQIQNGHNYLKTELNKNVQLISEDIYNLSVSDIGTFDLIIMRDVIEHIPNQEKFMRHLKQFIAQEGKVFFGFPPWQMPFGGHQQGCKSKIASSLPYYHLLPNPLYSLLMKMFGETQATIDSMLNTKSTGITIERFEGILKKNDYNINIKKTWFINPNYEVKFNLKPRKQLSLLARIPYFRNFVSTCVYYLVSNK